MSRGETIAFLLGLLSGASSMVVWCWWQFRRTLRDLRRAIRDLEKAKGGK